MGPPPVDAKSGMDKDVNKIRCNGETQRTLEPAESDLAAGESGGTASSGLADSSLRDCLDTRWRREEEDPPCKSDKSESSSSGGEGEDTEDQEGEFPANWYMPLPQDPQPSDEEVEEAEEVASEQLSRGASELPQTDQGDEQLEDVSEMLAASASEVKPSSTMEDSECTTSAYLPKSI